MIRFFVEPLSCVLIALGLSLGIAGIERFINRLNPFTRFQDDFMNSFYNPAIRAMWRNLDSFHKDVRLWFWFIGLLTGLVLLSIRYRMPKTILVYFSFFILVQGPLKLFVQYIQPFNLSRNLRRKEFILDTLDDVCLCAEEAVYGSIDKVDPPYPCG